MRDRESGTMRTICAITLAEAAAAKKSDPLTATVRAAVRVKLL